MPRTHTPGQQFEEVPDTVINLANLSDVLSANSLPQSPHTFSSQSPRSPDGAAFSASATSNNPEDDDGFLDLDTGDMSDPHSSSDTSEDEGGSVDLDMSTVPIPVAQNDDFRHWKLLLPLAILAARRVNRDFELSLAQDKEARASKIDGMRENLVPPIAPPAETPMLQQVPQVLRQYFLRLRDISLYDPCFGLDTLLDAPGAPKLDESIPDELAAYLHPIEPGSHEKVTTPNSRDPNGAGTSSQTGNRVLQLFANFPLVMPDQYALYLEVKQVGVESTTARLAVCVTVRYADTHTSEVFLTKFVKNQQDKCDTWHHLKAEGHFEVRPHNGTAYINVRIVQDDPHIEDLQGDIRVRSLALTPARMRYIEPVTPRLNDTSKPWYNLDASCSDVADVAAGAHQSRGRNFPVVTRLAASKDGKFLVVLVMSDSCIDIRVWRRDPESVFSRHADKSYTKHTLDFSNVSMDIVISAKGDMIAVFQVPKTGHWEDEKATFGVLLLHNDVARGDMLFEIPVPRTIKSALGFATFADEFTAGDTKFPTRFVFCDKRHVHVFVCQGWYLESKKTIPLPNKTSSSLWRTMACELLVRSIATNMFIWVEGNGRYCSTCDLSSGTAFGSIEISKAYGGDRHIATEMLVTCNQNRIALLGFDNSITIVDATTGILIGQYGFSGRTVEHIAFPSAHSQMLVARTRGEHEVKQTVLVLNTSQLSVHEEVSLLPSLSRLTVLGDFGQNPWPEFSAACQPDGGAINFYTCKVPLATLVGRREDPETFAPDCEFELSVTTPSLQREINSGQIPTERQVEIWRKSKASEQPRCIFSFIPEPWDNGSVKGKILSTGSSFVVWGRRTIQVWSLPSDEKSSCKLLYFWSAPSITAQKDAYDKVERDMILDYYSIFSAVHFHEFSNINQRRYRATVLIGGSEPKILPILGTSRSLDDDRMILQMCVESSRLLVLTYSELQQMGPDGDIYKEHTQAIVNFVNTYMNYTITGNGVTATTVLTHLLHESSPIGISGEFIRAVLMDKNCQWFLRYDEEFNALAVAIKRTNFFAVRAILDYCARRAHDTHPAYAMAAEHSFSALSTTYPAILQHFFKKTSYIRARNLAFTKAYVTSSDERWRARLHMLLSKLTRGIIDPPKLDRSIVTLQLSDPKNIPPSMPVHREYELAWYVVPFPGLIKLGPESQFRKMAGGNLFDNPALMSVLRYKTWHYGIYYWTARYFFLLVFYGIFVAMITWQLQITEVEPGLGRVENFLGANWFTLVIAGLVIGCYLLVQEVVQLRYMGLKYFRSLYNYIDITSIILTITCLVQIKNAQSRLDETLEVAVEQFGLTPFAILAMYLHVIAETRILRRVGTIVNIIALIAQKIWDFFIVFALVVAGFTHAFVYYFHAYRGGLDETRFSKSVLASFTTTFFFLAGRYDTVNDDFDEGDDRFLTLMLLFHLFTAIVMLTVLVALMTDAFSTTREEGEQVWRMQLSEALAEAEMSGQFLYGIARLLGLTRLVPFLKRAFSFRRAQYAPTFIYYAASTQDVEAFRHRVGRDSMDQDD